jgi:hypothetical protein
MTDSQGDWPAVRPDGLQMNEKRGFQETFWKVERIAWVVFGALVLLALVGFTGSGGFFSTTRHTIAEGAVTYPRVSRWDTADEVKITFFNGATNHRLEFQEPFASFFRIEDIQPRPQSSTAAKDGSVFEFAGEKGATVHVTLHIRAAHPGFMDAGVRIDGSEPVPLSTFVLP